MNVVPPSKTYSESANDEAARELAIGDLARRHGVSLRTLRFYEDKGLLTPRRLGNARFYSARDEVRLQLILTGKRLGFTLTEIAEIIEARLQIAPATAPCFPEALTKAELEVQIGRLENRRACLNDAIAELRQAHGLQHTQADRTLQIARSDA